MDFERALELNPEQPYVLNYLGYSWVDQGINLDRARKMIERAVELRPNDGYIVDSLGWVLYRLGDFRARSSSSKERLNCARRIRRSMIISVMLIGGPGGKTRPGSSGGGR